MLLKPHYDVYKIKPPGLIHMWRQPYYRSLANADIEAPQLFDINSMQIYGNQ